MNVKSLARFLPLGDAALTVEFGTVISREISARVVAAARAVQAAEIRGVHDIVPAFRSLTIHFDPLVLGQAQLAEAIGLLALSDEREAGTGRVVDMPVVYGGEAGPDLDAVAQEAGRTAAEVADLHMSGEYHVYMLGFLPGFAYLGDLPPSLRLPRLASPRMRVPAGSVAIADQMTAVYPVQSPGGWRLIGRTPLCLFDHAVSPPALLAPGDRVRFRAVDAAEAARIAVAVERSEYRP